MKKEYSVLLPVYEKDKAEYLRKSIESMRRQTIPPTDFVIISDGPLTQEVSEVIEEIRASDPCLFRFVYLPIHRGLGEALDVGVENCRCQVIARMDSDDISLPDRCERQLRAMEEQCADIVSGTVVEFDGEEENLIARRVLPETPEEILRFAARRNPFNHPCVMYKKSAVLQAGGYRCCPYFEDYDLWARMLKNGAVGYNIPEPLLYMRGGEAMYARRGGFSYGVLALKFRWQLRNMGISTFKDFLVAGFGQFLISILPNGCRKFFYKKALRKGEKEDG